MCGSTIISNRFLTTAKHCVTIGIFDAIPERSWVRVGGLLPTGGQQYHLENIVRHDTADLALLKTQGVIEVGTFVHPACLPKQTDCYQAGSEAWFSGFGTTEWMGNAADTLQGITFGIVGNEQCNDWWSSMGETITSNVVCAGTSAGGKDTCQGDSGGPMVVRKESVWYIYGVTSYGFKCAEPEAPGVYVRVSAYVDWIMANTDNLIVATGVLNGATACSDDTGVMTDGTNSNDNPQNVTPEGEIATTAPVTTKQVCTVIDNSAMTARFSDNGFWNSGGSMSFGGFPPEKAVDGLGMPHTSWSDQAISASKFADLIVNWSTEVFVSRVAVWPRADKGQDRYTELAVQVGGQSCVCQESCLTSDCIKELNREQRPVEFVCNEPASGDVVISNENDQILQVAEVQLFTC